MDIYYYCSYTGSPVGFVIGKIQNIFSEKHGLELDDKNINPFLRICLENGVIRKGCGVIPQNLNRDIKYFLVHKSSMPVALPLNTSVQCYINIAFLCDTKDEFVKIFNTWYSMPEDVSNSVVASTIEIDHGAKFGYNVNRNRLVEILNQSCGLNSDSPLLEFLTTGNSTYDFMTKNPNLPDLSRLLTTGVDSDFELILHPEFHCFILQKKKRALTHRFTKKYFVSTTIICLVVILGISTLSNQIVSGKLKKILINHRDIQRIYLTPESLSLDVFEQDSLKSKTATLNVSASPDIGPLKNVQYKSENEEIATVNQSGNVMIHKIGRTKIIATWDGMSDECVVQGMQRIDKAKVKIATSTSSDVTTLLEIQVFIDNKILPTTEYNLIELSRDNSIWHITIHGSGNHSGTCVTEVNALTIKD